MVVNAFDEGRSNCSVVDNRIFVIILHTFDFDVMKAIRTTLNLIFLANIVFENDISLRIVFLKGKYACLNEYPLSLRCASLRFAPGIPITRMGPLTGTSRNGTTVSRVVIPLCHSTLCLQGISIVHNTIPSLVSPTSPLCHSKFIFRQTSFSKTMLPTKVIF